MKELDLIEKVESRKEVMEKLNNIEVLDKVKEIITLKNTDFMTVKMVAKYYEVGLEAINSLIKDNREELIENGLITISGKETKKILGKSSKDITNFRGYFEYDGVKFNNRSNTLISKRVLLNIGMLLRDSKVAKELRKRILDIIYDAEEGKGSTQTIIEEIDLEKQLSMELGIAMVNGDTNKVMELSTRLFELKNKRIVELEEEVEVLSPLAEKYNIFLNTEGLTDISTLAKNLSIKGLGRNNMYRYLRDNKMLMEDNRPYQRYVESKYFVVKPCGSHIVKGEQVQDYKTFLTTKGVNKIMDMLKKDNLL